MKEISPKTVFSTIVILMMIGLFFYDDFYDF